MTTQRCPACNPLHDISRNPGGEDEMSFVTTVRGGVINPNQQHVHLHHGRGIRGGGKHRDSFFREQARSGKGRGKRDIKPCVLCGGTQVVSVEVAGKYLEALRS